jgi:ABC-type uncharacterized transport system substrate-binding protein
MRRRDVLSLLGGAAVPWPIAARAQQRNMPTIGFLGPATPSVASNLVAAFVERLRELGWAEGRNVTIEYRWAEGRSERYTEIAAEFVALQVDLMVTWASATVLAAKQATFAIPKSIKGRTDALSVATDPLVLGNRIQTNALAKGARLPTVYGSREYVEAGGFMSYGPSWPNLFRRAAELADKILRGAKPADIPVEQPTKFELVINVKTAKVLGLNIPPTLLALADEVIE